MAYTRREPAKRSPDGHRKFLEALIDIAYIAGHHKYHSGDSREDVGKFERWAGEFETIHKDTDWDVGPHDYIVAIEEFTVKKLAES